MIYKGFEIYYHQDMEMYAIYHADYKAPAIAFFHCKERCIGYIEADIKKEEA